MTADLKLKMQKNSELVECELKALLERDKDAEIEIIFEAERYSLLGGGKRIRPFITMEVCRMLGGDERAALRFACALEMIHVYSLIHDDLPCMDNDDMRRGKPTNHKVFGYSTAMLAGDALLTRAFFTASTNPYASAEASVEAVRLLSKAAGDEGMIGGQIMDLAGEKKSFELSQIVRLHSMKTGALIECAAYLGCLSAGYKPDSAEAERAVSYAKNVGLAFQVIDDILDVTSDEGTLGKSVNSDAESNKSTFVTSLGIDEAKKYAEALTAEAISQISELEHSETLTDLAVYLLDRTY